MALWPTLTILVGMLAWVLGTGFRQGPLVSPFSVTLLMLVSIFGVRPLLMLDTGTYDFYGINIASGFTAATVIGFVGVLSLVVGYAFTVLIRHGSARHPADGLLRSSPAPMPTTAQVPPAWTTSSLLTTASATAAFALLATWLFTMISLGGGLSYISLLFAGRSQLVGETFENVPALVPALPVIAALVVALTRFRFERIRHYALSQSVLYWIVVMLCIIPPSALGTRRFLVPSIVAALVGAAGSNWHRRIKLRWVAGASVAFIALAIFPFVRSAGSRTGDTSLIGAMGEYFGDQGVRGVINSFFLSYDTEMFNYVAYLAPRLGESIPFGLGRGTVGEAMLAPVPSALLPFETWSNQLLTSTFGGGCAEVSCPVPSVIGTLYYDLAFPGLIVGMLILGLLCAGFERRLLASHGVMTSLFLLMAGFTTVIVRGNPVSQLWIAAQCWAVLLLIDWLIRHFVRNAYHRRERMLIPARRQPPRTTNPQPAPPSPRSARPSTR